MREDHETKCANEQLFLDQYIEEIERLRANLMRAGVDVARSANLNWTHHDFARVPILEAAEIFGRVLLAADTKDIPREFYIGTRYREVLDLPVINFHLAAARAFYTPDDFSISVCPVRATRTIDCANDRVINVEDEAFEGSVHDVEWTLPHKPLSLPRPPRATEKAAAPRRSKTATKPAPSAAEGKAASVPVAQQAEESAPMALRAERALRQTLARPRTNRLESVLRTLQPDQYRLISSPIDESHVIQGGPGSGKTIIAVHRAALLAAPAHEGQQRASAASIERPQVRLVGPTDVFRDNVRQLLMELSASTLDIRAADPAHSKNARPPSPDLVAQTIWDLVHEAVTFVPAYKGMGIPVRPTDSTLLDDWGLVRAIETAGRVTAAWERASAGENKYLLMRSTYDVMRALAADDRIAGLPSETLAHIAALPRFDLLHTVPECWPLLALLLFTAQNPNRGKVNHVVVDEAQDVRALEWAVIRQRGRSANWTLVGDFNQRRANASPASWEEITGFLESGTPAIFKEKVFLDRAYRSNGPILEYASRLLPAGQRNFTAVQRADGGPVVRKVTELANGLREQLERIWREHPDWGVAVIGVSETPLQVMVNGDRGRGRREWVRGKSASVTTWHTDDHTVRYLDPNDCRGLEYDAVIVLEPAAFDRYEDNLRTLYVALTRANQHLVVLHQSPLPRRLTRR